MNRKQIQNIAKINSFRYCILRFYSKIVHLVLESASLFFKKKVTIFMLHHINEEKDFSITLANFKRFIEVLKTKTVIPLQGVLNKHNTQVYAITFDDVPETVYKYAYPLLKEYNIPFTLFVCTSMLNTEGYISKVQLIEMSQNENCTIGSHGVYHTFSRFQTKTQFHNEIKASKKCLEELIDKKVSLYAFPYGSIFTCSWSNVKELSKSNYYSLGFSTISAPVSLLFRNLRFFLPRVCLTDKYITNITNLL